MSKSQEDRLWRTFDFLRRHGRQADWQSLIREAEAEGVPLDRIRSVVTQKHSPEFYPCPPIITDFVASYLQLDVPHDTILDVWTGTGGMIAPVVERSNPKAAIALSRNIEVHELAKVLNPDQRIQ